MSPDGRLVGALVDATVPPKSSRITGSPTLGAAVANAVGDAEGMREVGEGVGISVAGAAVTCTSGACARTRS